MIMFDSELEVDANKDAQATHDKDMKKVLSEEERELY